MSETFNAPYLDIGMQGILALATSSSNALDAPRDTQTVSPWPRRIKKRFCKVVIFIGPRWQAI
jgi:hypothetical protein